MSRRAASVPRARWRVVHERFQDGNRDESFEHGRRAIEGRRAKSKREEDVRRLRGRNAQSPHPALEKHRRPTCAAAAGAIELRQLRNGESFQLAHATGLRQFKTGSTRRKWKTSPAHCL